MVIQFLENFQYGSMKFSWRYLKSNLVRILINSFKSFKSFFGPQRRCECIEYMAREIQFHVSLHFTIGFRQWKGMACYIAKKPFGIEAGDNCKVIMPMLYSQLSHSKFLLVNSKWIIPLYGIYLICVLSVYIYQN